MLEKLKGYTEPDRRIRLAEYIILAALLLVSAFSFVRGWINVNGSPGSLAYSGTLEMTRDFEE
ncbi:MAG: hypothetical protein IKG55_07265, partial [Solobacterium sp.]|nr:hypothetical protein [Solobacterium sp.]